MRTYGSSSTLGRFDRHSRRTHRAAMHAARAPPPAVPFAVAFAVALSVAFAVAFAAEALGSTGGGGRAGVGNALSAATHCALATVARSTRAPAAGGAAWHAPSRQTHSSAQKGAPHQNSPHRGHSSQRDAVW